MVEAAILADALGSPLCRLLTIRTSGMRLSGDGGIFRKGTQSKCIRKLLDKILRWLKYRGIPVALIWVREYSSKYWNDGEHLHIGYHMTVKHDLAFARQLAQWLDEDIGDSDGRKDTIVMSELSSWNIRGCVRGNTTGKGIAAYLGKSEPNTITTAWEKEKPNKRKHNNKKPMDGNGPIECTDKHHYRWGTSTSLGPKVREEYRRGTGQHAHKGAIQPR